MKLSREEILKKLGEKGIPLEEDANTLLGEDFEAYKKRLLRDLDDKIEKEKDQIIYKLKKLARTSDGHLGLNWIFDL